MRLREQGLPLSAVGNGPLLFCPSVLNLICQSSLTACGSSAIMSPRNCLAIMSPPGIGSYSLGRRSYGRRGADRESERSTADARDPVDVRGASERWERGRAFGSFSSSGKAVEKQEAGEKSAGGRACVVGRESSSVAGRGGSKVDTGCGHG